MNKEFNKQKISVTECCTDVQRDALMKAAIIPVDIVVRTSHKCPSEETKCSGKYCAEATAVYAYAGLPEEYGKTHLMTSTLSD